MNKFCPKCGGRLETRFIDADQQSRQNNIAFEWAKNALDSLKQKI